MDSLLIAGIVECLIGFFMFLFRPKYRLYVFYGYRTPRAVRNEENWNMAQKVCSITMLTCGGSLMLIWYILTNSKISNSEVLLLRTLAGMIFLISVVLTEMVLIFRSNKLTKPKAPKPARPEGAPYLAFYSNFKLCYFSSALIFLKE